MEYIKSKEILFSCREDLLRISKYLNEINKRVYYKDKKITKICSESLSHYEDPWLVSIYAWEKPGLLDRFKGSKHKLLESSCVGLVDDEIAFHSLPAGPIDIIEPEKFKEILKQIRDDEFLKDLTFNSFGLRENISIAGDYLMFKNSSTDGLYLPKYDEVHLGSLNSDSLKKENVEKLFEMKLMSTLVPDVIKDKVHNYGEVKIIHDYEIPKNKRIFTLGVEENNGAFVLYKK